MRVICEGVKLAYADFLLRCELLGPRATLLQYDFLEENGTGVRGAAAGDETVLVKPLSTGNAVTDGIRESL